MILVIDFGSQFTQLVARRVRELSIYSEIVPFKNATERIEELKRQNILSGIVFSGGPHSVYENNSPKIDLDLEKIGVPVLGVCYGLQLINYMLGGKVAPSKNREYGFEKIIVEKNISSLNPLFKIKDIEENIVWMSHGDEIQELSSKLTVDSVTRNNVISSFHHKELPIFGVQFHPEVEHSKYGREIIKQFVEEICQDKKEWDSSLQIERAVELIKNQVEKEGKDTQVICALSGGVDSCVAAVLTQKAVGDKLLCLFINNGLLRKNEYEDVLARFKKDLNLNVKGVDASELFLSRLKGVSDPETKRKIIGNTFIDVFESETKDLPNAKFLVQGTLYPDVIESISIHGTSVTIKTHHNVGGLPEKMKFKLIEPLRELFKDEVRRLGAEMGIPQDMLARHPFPGPGLGIRVLGEVTKERLQIAREADAIFIEELKKQNLYNTTWQAFVVLLPVSSVGVMGDGRTYESVAAIRCVSATDGMTADWSKLPYEFLAHVSSRIINEVKGINRVVYDISTKPPATIEWE
ncbi:glutamine-hydrolyzing GMP synthase [Silvanigrella aquatica]|uniref:GMP synthase [glutamine-hydrolyzing] n=1 Tax=Silvanigrella aquatica TaxID=1915309 RepID=A0A1L4D3R9_9BACT|nr:glutamine-hydrolyzing GMP synthase [Silvanigrella aquatica]APJ04865.1 glutamine-hydrolyzing GMP synthase [Silvanigrella aquatica]